jgi:hypothetical protein
MGVAGLPLTPDMVNMRTTDVEFPDSATHAGGVGALPQPR